jgi:hypothetical protein
MRVYHAGQNRQAAHVHSRGGSHLAQRTNRCKATIPDGNIGCCQQPAG